MPELHEGDEFAGHRIVGIAGRGGMGVVYRAIQLDLDRPVALKLIAPQLAQESGFRDRFARESRAAASIDHPNVIPIYYTGESDGALYIAMRYVEGSDLRTLVRAAGRLDPPRAAQIVSQVAAALDAAHARGIVHRDVKPANVLLGASDHVYLTDFGLTKRLTSGTGSTRDGGWVGTLGYVAPEQIRGERLDARADVYALGCVLFHALTGAPPYQRESDEATLWAHLHDDPPSVSHQAPGVSARFDGVLSRALAKDPEARFPSAGDFGRAALAAAGRDVATGPERSVAVGEAAPGDEDVTVASPDQAATVAVPRARRGVWPWALAAIPVAALVVVAVIALSGGGGDGGGHGPGGATAQRTTPGGASSAGRVAATVKVGARPNSITVAGGSVWVTSAQSDRLAIISTASGKLRTSRPRVGARPAAAAAGFGRLWVANDSIPSVVPIGLHSLRQAGAQIPLPAEGQVVAIDAGLHAVWVGIRVPRAPALLIRYDPKTGAEVKRIELPDGLQNMAEGAGAVWVLARRANTLTRVDTRTGNTQSVNVGSHPADVTVGAGAVWVTNAQEDTVTRIDPGSLSTSTVPVGREPQGISVGAGAVWVADRVDSTLTRIDPATSKRVGEPVEVEATPYALDVAGRQVWVGSLGNGTVQRVDF